MGILDKLRAEFIDIIEWVDDSNRTLVWRFPRYQNEIKHGAQLIVRPGQTAIFVHRGRIADVFTPGNYRLTTRNLPILGTLQGWKHGFDSPFRSEVYFCSTHQVTDLKWGTPNPVIIRDREFGPVRVRAFGTYTLRASDPRALLSELVGTDAEFDAEEISVLLKSIITTTFSDLVASAGISVLDLASNYQEISDQLRQAVLERVDDEYGLDIPQLYIVNISVPEEVERALDARSSMGIVGDLAAYQQYQIGQSIPAAATSPAGGLAGAGVGLGMGMAVAGRMGAMPEGGAMLQPEAPPPAPVATNWHWVEAGQTMGPIGADQLAEAIATGRVKATSYLWSAGMSNWQRAAELAQWAPYFQAPPPPPPAG